MSASSNQGSFRIDPGHPLIGGDMRKIIRHKGFEILHRHISNAVFFQAFLGNSMVNNRAIKIHNGDINWKFPLTDEEKDFLIKEDKKGEGND